VFWAFMADVWRTDQGKRLFGLISVGGSVGAVLGPAVTAGTVGVLGPELLLVLAAVLLEGATFSMLRVAAWHRRVVEQQTNTDTATTADAEAPVGGGVISGLKPVVRSPFLAAAALYMLSASLSGNFNYYLQARLAAATGGDQVVLTQLFARVDLAANILTAGAQGLLSGRLMARWGVTPALALLPLVSLAGFASSLFLPLLVVVATTTVVRRATSYGLSTPAFGVLFTVVSREEKYKVRPFIDTVVYRGGDLTAGWLFTGLLSLGVGLSGVSAVGAAVAVPWFLLARYLGREHRRLAS
jgi:AAA family ATP:ADP antiporter